MVPMFRTEKRLGMKYDWTAFTKHNVATATFSDVIDAFKATPPARPRPTDPDLIE